MNFPFLLGGNGVGGAGDGIEGNGCAKFVEIATQTMNLTNFLTNLNSSATICNNTSEPNSEQMVTPTLSIISPTSMLTSVTATATATAMPMNDENHHHQQQQQQQHQFDGVPNAHQSQSHNPKSNNGHCIVDGTPDPDVSVAVTQVTPLHHSFDMGDIDVGSVIETIDTYQSDSTNSDLVLKHDPCVVVTAMTTAAVATVVTTAVTTTATPMSTVPEPMTMITVKASTEIDTITADEPTTDLGRNHTTTDGSGINGPTNDLRV